MDLAVTAAPRGAPGGMTRSVAGMGAAAAVSRAFGGLRMVVIAGVLGTTHLGNAFQSSNSVSNVLFELLAAGALSAVLVPTFVELLASGDPRRAEEVAGRVLSIALVVLGAVTLVGVAAAPAIARLLTTGVADAAVAADQRELATFLLRFFIPQILLYAVGAVCTAVLHARGSFALTAIAPIGNTVVLVAALVLFRDLVGPNPGLDLPADGRLCLAVGGTLGVAAFVAVPAVAVWRSGFRLRLGLRGTPADEDVRRLVRLSGWAALQHAGTGVLLAAALVVAGSVEGGVVAYQLAMVVFLAPYGIVAQPIHTAVLPRLADDVARGDTAGLRRAMRWAIDALVVATVPLAAGLAALSLPVMEILAFGEAGTEGGPSLLAGALLGLAVGVPVYGGFLLLTRAAYALGDSRTPALASMGSAVVGAAAMVVAGLVWDGTALLVAVGLSHSVAYGVGGVLLAGRLRAEIGPVGTWAHLRPLAAAAAAAGAAWLLVRAWQPAGRPATALALGVAAAVAGAAYVGAVRALDLGPGAAPPLHRVEPA